MGLHMLVYLPMRGQAMAVLRHLHLHLHGRAVRELWAILPLFVQPCLLVQQVQLGLELVIHLSASPKRQL